MKDKQIEEYFTAIKEDHDRLEEKVDKGFARMDSQFNQVNATLETITDTLRVLTAMNETHQGEHRSIEKRLTKLEHAHA